MDFERGPVINSHIRVWRHRDDSKRGKFPQQQIAQWRTPLRLIEGNQQKIRVRLRYQGGYDLLDLRGRCDRATRLARLLLNALRGEAVARKKICAGKVRSAARGFPVSGRRRKSRR